MKFKHAIFLFISLLCFSAYAEESKIHLLENSTYHGDEVEDVKNGETWMAIIGAHGAYTARPVTVFVKTVKDEVIDPDKGPFTGKEITSHPHYPDAEFLIKGMALKAGAPIESYPTDRLSIAKGKTAEIKGSKATVTLVGKGGVHLKGDGYETHDAYQLIGKVGNKEFSLIAPADLSNDDLPYLMWAGDLNQDGYPDFLINISDHYNVNNPAVFLSKVSKSGVSYDKVAERYSVGC